MNIINISIILFIFQSSLYAMQQKSVTILPIFPNHQSEVTVRPQFITCLHYWKNNSALSPDLTEHIHNTLNYSVNYTLLPEYLENLAKQQYSQEGEVTNIKKHITLEIFKHKRKVLFTEINKLDEIIGKEEKELSQNSLN